MPKYIAISIFIFFLFSFNQPIAKEIHFTKKEKEWIKQHPKVTYGYGYQFQPFQINKDGKFFGISRDYIELLSKKSGIEFIGKKYPSWEATFQAMKEGEVDMLPNVAYTKYRAKYMLFAKPHISHPLVIVTRKGYPFVSNLEAFRGKTMSLPYEFASTESIVSSTDNINFIFKDDIYQSLVDVSSGKAEGTAGDLPVVSYFLYYRGFQNLKIAAPLSSMNNIELGFGVKKDAPELKSIIDKVLASVTTQERNKIYQKWISVKYDYGVNLKQVWFYSLLSLIVVIVIIIIILMINRRLKKEIKARRATEKELEQSLEIIHKKNDEKQAMLKEIHHRVKNNLQIISSLLRFQSNKLKDENITALFDEAQGRVLSMALLHEKLYKSDNLKNIDVREYFSLLLNELMANYDVADNIKLNLKIENILLNSKTMAPLGLIINEIVTNSIKHAFTDAKNYEEKIIEVICKKGKEGTYILEIGDNGKGLSKNILSGEPETMGTELITIFVEQLEGEITLLDKKGTYFHISFREIN